jgi:hypothetical protein
VGFIEAGYGSLGTDIVNAFGLLGEFDLLGEARTRVDDAGWLDRAAEESRRFCTAFPAAPVVAVSEVSWMAVCGLLPEPSADLVERRQPR